MPFIISKAYHDSKNPDLLQDEGISKIITLQSRSNHKINRKLMNLKRIIENYDKYYESLFLKAIIMVYGFSILLKIFKLLFF